MAAPERLASAAGTRAPRPSPSLLALTRPPDSCISRCTMNSPKPGAVVAAARAGIEPRELAEQLLLVGDPKTNAAVAHGEFDLDAHGAGGERDLAAADRRHGGQRVLQHIAHHRIHGDGIGQHLQLRGTCASMLM